MSEIEPSVSPPLPSKPILPYKTFATLIYIEDDEPWWRLEMEHLRLTLGYDSEHFPIFVTTRPQLPGHVQEIRRLEDPVVFVQTDGALSMEHLACVYVLQELEKYHIPFIGPSSHYAMLTCSKLAMKRKFRDAGVPTAPWIESLEDLGRVKFSYPLFVKTELGSGSEGLTENSRCNNEQELRAQWKSLESTHRDFRIFAEEFIEGPEFTILVYGSANEDVCLIGDQKETNDEELKLQSRPTPDYRAFPAVERVFNSFGSFKVAAEYDVPTYTSRLAPPELQEPLIKMALDAYRAIGGDSCGRVDIRVDAKTGNLLVLEVNSLPCFGEVDHHSISMACVLYNAKARLCDMMRFICPHPTFRQPQYDIKIDWNDPASVETLNQPRAIVVAPAS